MEKAAGAKRCLFIALMARTGLFGQKIKTDCNYDHNYVQLHLKKSFVTWQIFFDCRIIIFVRRNRLRITTRLIWRKFYNPGIINTVCTVFKN